jgi:hypothetical protein
VRLSTEVPFWPRSRFSARGPGWPACPQDQDICLTAQAATRNKAFSGCSSSSLGWLQCIAPIHGRHLVGFRPRAHQARSRKCRCSGHRSRMTKNLKGFIALWPIPEMGRGGIPPPTPVLAPGSALGSRPRVALSSAQVASVYRSALRPGKGSLLGLGPPPRVDRHPFALPRAAQVAATTS